jgi:predicted amidohydrolase
VANWPKIRTNAWDALLKARAIENMSYCIGVNRVGLDGNDYEYIGHSGAYDVLGHRMDTIPENEEATEIVVLEKEHITTYREKLGFLNDRDNFSLK